MCSHTGRTFKGQHKGSHANCSAQMLLKKLLLKEMLDVVQPVFQPIPFLKLYPKSAYRKADVIMLCISSQLGTWNTEAGSIQGYCLIFSAWLLVSCMYLCMYVFNVLQTNFSTVSLK